MVNHILKLSRKSLINWGLVFLSLYVFLACLLSLLPLRTGLDPSWAYGIYKAAQQRLIFGRDIIFTYGPLGYLVSQYFPEKHFFSVIVFNWMAYLILWILILVKTFQINKAGQKMAFFFGSLLAISNLYFPTNYPFTDYQIVFIVLLILSFEEFLNRSLSWCFLGLGALAGFFILTKFSLGIYILGSLSLFLVGNLYTSLRQRTEITELIFAFLNTFIGAISIAFILLSPDYYWTNFLKIITVLAIASLSCFFFYITQYKRNKIDIISAHDEKRNPNQLNDYPRVKLLTRIIFYIVYSILLLTIVFRSFPYLIDYLKNFLELSGGYSSAMSYIPGFTKQKFLVIIISIILILIPAIIQFFLISIILLFVAKEKYFGFALALLFGLFFSFKHGFVRQDFHIIIYSFTAYFVLSLAITKLKKFSSRKFAYGVLVYTIFINFSFNIFINNFGGEISSMSPLDIFYGVKNLTPIAVVNNISSLNLEASFTQLQKQSFENLKKVKLPENVLSVVRGKTIDIIPWEISLVAANELNWKPRPIFQSYSAFTGKLDHINFESLSKDPRDYIFYNFKSIDERHPFFDEPQTFTYVFCNYQPSSTIKDFINLPKLPNTILLEKRDSSRCLSPLQGETVSIPWKTSQSINATDDTLIRASIKFQYSILGKIAKAIFRIPPVMMEVTYQDGSTKKYRIIPENSENGVIVSQLPRNDDEAMSFLKGNLLPPVKSFQFNPTNPLLYTSKIKITFSSEVLQE